MAPLSQHAALSRSFPFNPFFQWHPSFIMNHFINTFETSPEDTVASLTSETKPPCETSMDQARVLFEAIDNLELRTAQVEEGVTDMTEELPQVKHQLHILGTRCTQVRFNYIELGCVST